MLDVNTSYIQYINTQVHSFFTLINIKLNLSK